MLTNDELAEAEEFYANNPPLLAIFAELRAERTRNEYLSAVVGDGLRLISSDTPSIVIEVWKSSARAVLAADFAVVDSGGD